MPRPRSTSTRWTGRSRAVWLGMALVGFLSGCTTPLAMDSPGFSLKEARLEHEIAKQAEKDPFPTPTEAGIRE